MNLVLLQFGEKVIVGDGTGTYDLVKMCSWVRLAEIAEDFVRDCVGCGG